MHSKFNISLDIGFMGLVPFFVMFLFRKALKPEQ